MSQTYTVLTANHKGILTVKADDLEVLENWLVFRRGGKVTQAFPAQGVAYVSEANEDGSPRMNVAAQGEALYEGLVD